jgi:alpha-1,3-rhamnosyl/mannosyltransferase
MRPHYILDARTATPHFPGIGRYVANLARALMPLLTLDERLTILHDPAHPISLPPSDDVRTVPLAVSPFSLAQQWAVPLLMRCFRARGGDIPASNAQLPAPSLYHSPYVAMPYLPGVPALLTVYDLIPLRYPAYSTARARLLIRWMTRLALRATRHVIAISDFTRRDFMAEFGLGREQITAIPLAADPAFRPQTAERIAEIRTHYVLPERFVLYLGSNKPHKNLVRLVEAWQVANSTWQIAESRLVIAGA